MQKRIAVLGGGISGLAMAFYLRRAFHRYPQIKAQVVLMEKSPRLGGWIASQDIGGFFFESGPHTLRPRGKGVEILHLAEELGLQDEVIASDEAARRRYLFVEGRLQQLPTGPLGLVMSPLMRGVLPALWRELRIAPVLDDESIDAFICRRLSPQIADCFVDAFVSGTWAGDMRTLSVEACFPILKRWEREHGSLLKGFFSRGRAPGLSTSAPTSWAKQFKRRALISFRGGMETLVHALGRQLPEALCNCGVQKLTPLENGMCVLAQDRQWQFDHVVSTLPPSALAKLLVPHEGDLASSLAGIPMASLVTVHVGYDRRVLPLRGFGYLVPEMSRQNILGVLWDSEIFPQQNRRPGDTRLTVMLGGMRHPELLACSESQLEKLALDALEQHLQITDRPSVVAVNKCRDAIPQYNLGHLERCKMMQQLCQKRWPSLTLGGNSFGGISVGDCISRAKVLAEEVCERLST